VTDLGHKVLFQNEHVVISAPRATANRIKKTADLDLGEHHPDLFQRLRALRKRVADERNTAPYVIFHDSTLRQMAADLPATPADMLLISGIGRQKALDFGEAFLAEIAAYVGETGARPIQRDSPPPRLRRSRGSLGVSIHNTVGLFQEGHDIAAIAETRGLAQVTVEGHLAEAIEAGESVEIERLVSAERLKVIESAFEELGLDLLGPVKERLGEDYSYGELRLVRAALRRARDV
jgi:ATP-dependent DNA helicase RecQ